MTREEAKWWKSWADSPLGPPQTGLSDFIRRIYNSYLALLDERDRLRGELAHTKDNLDKAGLLIAQNCAGLGNQDRELAVLRARNEKLEAVLVAADSYVKFGTREAALRKAIAAAEEE